MFIVLEGAGRLWITYKLQNESQAGWFAQTKLLDFYVGPGQI
jgi:hypothetical protein